MDLQSYSTRTTPGTMHSNERPTPRPLPGGAEVKSPIIADFPDPKDAKCLWIFKV